MSARIRAWQSTRRSWRGRCRVPSHRALDGPFSKDTSSDGVMENATFLDYRMPTAADVPPIETLLVEVNSGVEPYGIRGVGEPPIVPGPAAMANAIMSATGVRLKELPMTPEAILNALKSKGK